MPGGNKRCGFIPGNSMLGRPVMGQGTLMRDVTATTSLTTLPPSPSPILVSIPTRPTSVLLSAVR